MASYNRKTGIDVTGDVHWGTHICLLYQTKQDLIDTLVGYFKAGIDNNELCIWITSAAIVCLCWGISAIAVIAGL